jgi:exonuclease VII large subunit
LRGVGWGQPARELFELAMLQQLRQRLSAATATEQEQEQEQELTTAYRLQVKRHLLQDDPDLAELPVDEKKAELQRMYEEKYEKLRAVLARLDRRRGRQQQQQQQHGDDDGGGGGGGGGGAAPAAAADVPVLPTPPVASAATAGQKRVRCDDGGCAGGCAAGGVVTARPRWGQQQQQQQAPAPGLPTKRRGVVGECHETVVVFEGAE